MNKLLLGFAIGALTGAVAFKKMEESKVPVKVLKTAQKKLENG